MNNHNFGFAIPRLPALGFGGDWNPEQWPENIWDEDIELMQQAHVNLVTIGVFSWAHLEPEPNTFRFEWLDRVVEKCATAGISIDMATATASPPPWLGHRWPETLPVTDEGVRLSYGARQQYCPSSSVYRDRALQLTERVAQRYADHDSVVMWHVGNEFGAHTPMCWCDLSATAFRDWLTKRHGDLDALNEAWSTAFWSQRFSDWDEVIPPRKTPYFPNPTQQLDFKRFSSDAMLELFLAERDVIRTYSPDDKPITTNFMRFFPHNNYWEWAACEDVVSDDWYPDLADPRSYIEGAAGADLMRSLGSGRPWLLMEQAVSAINWRTVNPVKPTGAYRRWSLQQVARGADSILHFQWRAAVGGAEKWHSGMLPHAGPRTRTWNDVVALGNELGHMQQVTGSRTNAKIAIVFDWSAWWALELDSRPNTELGYVSVVLSWYEALWSRGYSIDFVHPESDLSQYSLILVPQLYLVSDRGAESIVQASSSGATVVIGYFSGATDSCDRVRAGGYPAPWLDLLGLWVEEYRPLLPGEVYRLSGDVSGSMWSEHIHVTGAETVMTYIGGDLDSLPAVTRNPTGMVHGKDNFAWYISTQLDQEALDRLLVSIAVESGAEPNLQVPPPNGVEVALRENESAQFLFILNHNNHETVVSIPEGTWTIINTPLDKQHGEVVDEIRLCSGEVFVLAQPKERK